MIEKIKDKVLHYWADHKIESIVFDGSFYGTGIYTN